MGIAGIGGGPSFDNVAAGIGERVCMGRVGIVGKEGCWIVGNGERLASGNVVIVGSVGAPGDVGVSKRWLAAYQVQISGVRIQEDAPVVQLAGRTEAAAGGGERKEMVGIWTPGIVGRPAGMVGIVGIWAVWWLVTEGIGACWVVDGGGNVGIGSVGIVGSVGAAGDAGVSKRRRAARLASMVIRARNEARCKHNGVGMLKLGSRVIHYWSIGTKNREVRGGNVVRTAGIVGIAGIGGSARLGNVYAGIGERVSIGNVGIFGRGGSWVVGNGGIGSV
ncbi:uncharacterized protein A4U43_C08F23250 [Asparagus officinalis]|nr:uncharacterized protein A4U43_C08F23250 [Asparagus officinalis]